MAGPGSSRKRAREHNNAIRTNGKKARLIHHRQQNYHSSSEDSNNDDTTASFFPNSIAAKTTAEKRASHNSEGEEENEDGVEVAQEDSEEDDDEDKRLNAQEEDSGEEDGGNERDGDEGGIDFAEDDDDEANNDEFDEALLAQDSSASDSDSDSPANSNFTTTAPHKHKKNDPASFAFSMQKILTTKTKSSDPMLSRSSAAQTASRTAIDSALEAKAKKILKESNLLALEKGRVKDVLEPSVAGMPEVQLSTTRSMEEEKRLRKVAQKGVIRLFNAVRVAQVRATEAQRVAREEGVLGIKKREETVQEMTKKGFLDLIASGGGGLKKGPIEEA